MDNYKAEAKIKWGNTKPYKEFKTKTANYTEENLSNITEGLDDILRKFAECKTLGNTSDSNNARSIVKELQNFITNNFYTCTDEIFKGLGVMYTADERFKSNIDKHGSGTADFISSAIKIYTK